MKVHEILDESTVNEVFGRLAKQVIKGVSASGVKRATESLSKHYGEELTNAYKLGIQAKPLTADYAEKYFISLGYSKSIAKELSSNKSILDEVARDADKIAKATAKLVSRAELSKTSQKIFTDYKIVFAGVQGWQIMAVPTRQFLAKLDVEHEKYQKGEISLEVYQSRRQALATVYVSQLGAGIAVWAALRGSSFTLKKIVGVLPDSIANPINLVLRGATDAALLHFEINYLNTPEGRRAIADFIVENAIGQYLQKAVGSRAVNAGNWIQQGLNASIQAVNKLPGVNIKTTPAVPVPGAPPAGANTPPPRPLVTPRTSFSLSGKDVLPQQ